MRLGEAARCDIKLGSWRAVGVEKEVERGLGCSQTMFDLVENSDP